MLRHRFFPLVVKLVRTVWVNLIEWQECIPVGSVPAAHWPYAGGGLLCQREVPPSRGVSLPGGASLWGSPCQGVPPSGGVSLPGGCLLRGVSLPGDASFLGGLLAGGVLLGGSPCQGVPPSQGVASFWGGVSLQGRSHCRENPPLWTESQTRVKT